MSNVAVDYVEAGLALVPIPYAMKGPTHQGWNTRERCITTPEAAGRLNGRHNLGLAHAFSSPTTGAVDVDNIETAASWLAARGIDLGALLMDPAAVQIRSGVVNRAKLLYRLPRSLRTAVIAVAHLELRCAADNDRTCQDVLPPSLHPVTQKPYEWLGDYHRIPDIPPVLLDLWQSLVGGGNGKRSRRQREEDDAQADPVLRALDGLGLLIRRSGEGKYSMHCPFAHEHTTPGGESGCVYWLPWYGGYERGAFKCLHAHCVARVYEDFLQAIGLGAEAEAEPAEATAPKAEDWPVLDREAFHGLAGDIVRTVEPYSEADPAAVLLQTLAAFGVLVGRGPHVQVEGDQHHANINVLLVGKTSKGRKGTSWGRVRSIFSNVEGWPPTESGLSTGEGLKWRVRDAVCKLERGKKGQEPEMVQTDPGVSDKRLLIIEEEFAQALRVGARPGNTLSPCLREAWNGRRLGSLTKNDTVVATGVHISIVGHIVMDELRAELTATDQGNGYANRFLFCLVRRSKVLPFGGVLDPEAVRSLVERIENAASAARSREVVHMDPVARACWEKVYPKLSEGAAGLFGAVTARSEAQTLRLALILALLDRSPVIRQQHLVAALHVWEYCEHSARLIFGTALGDRVADEILAALRNAPEGMTRTQIRDLFLRHQSNARIEIALASLAARHLVVKQVRQSGGRPVEVWTIAT